MNTSINVRMAIFNEITTFSKNSGFSKSKLIRILINKIKNFNSIEEVKGALIEYQNRISIDDDNVYERIHYCPDSIMVDFTKSLRFKFRLSISAFVTAAFLFFWDEIVKEIMGENESEKFINNYEKIIELLSLLKSYFSERLNYKEINPIKRE